MKSLKFYKNKLKMIAYRNRHRKANYDKGDFSDIKWRHYTSSEDYEILFSDKTDRENAKYLKRSVRSIQKRRWSITHNKVKSAYNNAETLNKVGEGA
jgi:hypothetical protein